MILRVALATALVLGAAGTAQAEFNYNFVQAGYGQVDFDDAGVDGDNLGISLSLALTDEFHVFGGADYADLEAGVDATSWRAGVGYNTAISSVIDVIGQLSFQSVDLDTPVGNADETGFGLGVALRIAATDLVEINAGIEYVDIDVIGENTVLTGAALFNLTERISIGVTGRFDDDVTLYSLAGRLYF